MTRTWVHVGRVWSNGEPMLVADATVATDWRASDDDAFRRVVDHGQEIEPFTVGPGAGVLVGDPVVRDDSWLEVFTAPDGSFAVVQADADDYAAALRTALAVVDDAESGSLFEVTSGSVVVMSAAGDGAGGHAQPLTPPRPGPDPRDHPLPDDHAEHGLVLDVPVGAYVVSGTWYTELDDGCYARWRFLRRGGPTG